MSKPIPGSFKALLLEDDPINEEIFCGYLELLGRPRPTVVGTLADAAALREAMLEGEFDLIVFDVMLPDGESLGLAQELAGKLPCPLAAYTARASPMELRQLHNAGFDHVFKKPMPIERFREGMEALL